MAADARPREEAEAIVDQIEARSEEHRERSPDPDEPLDRSPRERMGFGEIASTVLQNYPSARCSVSSLMVARRSSTTRLLHLRADADDFYGVRPDGRLLYLLPFALGNFLGPLLLGHLFDTVGRKPMIASTYISRRRAAGLHGAACSRGRPDAATQTLAWCVIFFFASAGASAAYLTVSEIFPLEIRAHVRSPSSTPSAPAWRGPRRLHLRGC